MELSRILVGVDGSPAASAALRWAATAVASGGEVVALHATRSALIAQAAIAATTGLGVFRDSEGPEEVDLIVIGHDRSTGFVDRLFDDLDDDLLDRARRPVVIVPRE